MGATFVFFLLLGIVSGVFLVGMFFPKDNIALNVASLALAVVVSILIGYIAFTSLPSNALFGKIIACVLIILPLVVIGLFLGKIIKYPILKLLIAVLLILNFTFSLFGTSLLSTNETNQKTEQSLNIIK